MAEAVGGTREGNGSGGAMETTDTSERNGARGRVLVTGASGYVGGRLLQALEARRVPCCLARTPSLRARGTRHQVFP
jgi:hypothetical protein